MVFDVKRIRWWESMINLPNYASPTIYDRWVGKI